jgi:hypothetical protein
MFMGNSQHGQRTIFHKRTLAHGLSIAPEPSAFPDRGVDRDPDGKLTPQAIEPDVLAVGARSPYDCRRPEGSLQKILSGMVGERVGVFHIAAQRLDGFMP